MTRAAYEAVDHYECSTPTGPSDGRVYRRLHRVDGQNDEPVLFIVADAPEDDPRGGQLHHPHHVLFVEA